MNLQYFTAYCTAHGEHKLGVSDRITRRHLVQNLLEISCYSENFDVALFRIDRVPASSMLRGQHSYSTMLFGLHTHPSSELHRVYP